MPPESDYGAYEQRTAKATAPQVTQRLEHLEKASVTYQEMIERLQMRLAPLVVPMPRPTNGVDHDRHPEGALAPLAERMDRIACQLRNSNVLLGRLIESLEI